MASVLGLGVITGLIPFTLTNVTPGLISSPGAYLKTAEGYQLEPEPIR